MCLRRRCSWAPGRGCPGLQGSVLPVCGIERWRWVGWIRERTGCRLFYVLDFGVGSFPGLAALAAEPGLPCPDQRAYPGPKNSRRAVCFALKWLAHWISQALVGSLPLVSRVHRLLAPETMAARGASCSVPTPTARLGTWVDGQAWVDFSHVYAESRPEPEPGQRQRQPTVNKSDHHPVNLQEAAYSHAGETRGSSMLH